MKCLFSNSFLTIKLSRLLYVCVIVYYYPVISLAHYNTDWFIEGDGRMFVSFLFIGYYSRKFNSRNTFRIQDGSLK